MLWRWERMYGYKYSLISWSIFCISPRVIICEIHNIIPSDISVTVPYSDNFYCWDKPFPEYEFRSASLLAMKKLFKSKGYRLVGDTDLDLMFFMRDGCWIGIFP